MNLIDFKKKAWAQYLPLFINNDKGHNITHINDVCELALEMNKKLCLDIDEKEIVLAAYLHDSCMYDRENHHLHAYEYIMSAVDYFLSDLTPDSKKSIAQAVLEHRASYKGLYYSKLSELISAADRGPLDSNKTISRSINFIADKYKVVVKDEIIKDVLFHIKDKFSSSGYARYNEVYKSFFKDALLKMQLKMDKITYAEIESIYDSIDNEG